MGDNIEILRIENTDSQFYVLIGPFLSKRCVVKELGYAVWDDDEKIWFVSVLNGEAIGFVAAVESKGKVIFCSDYVVPGRRNAGNYKRLFKKRLDYYRCKSISATVTASSLKVYTVNGFTEKRRRGKYIVVERAADVNG